MNKLDNSLFSSRIRAKYNVFFRTHYLYYYPTTKIMCLIMDVNIGLVQFQYVPRAKCLRWTRKRIHINVSSLTQNEQK